MKIIQKIDYPPYPNPIIYDVEVGKSGRGWLIPNNIPNKADMLHVTAYPDWDRVGEGYAGGTLIFHTSAGEFKLHGGWHSNPDGLFHDTGIDVRGTTLTRGVIAKVCVASYPNYTMDEFLLDENEWVLGTFNRVKDLAKDYADTLNIPVFSYMQSLGGASMGWKKPSAWSDLELREYLNKN